MDISINSILNVDKPMRKKEIIPAYRILIIIVLSIISVRCQQLNENFEINKNGIAIELLNELNNDFSLWYPLSLDTVYGGFFSDINYKWELQGKQNKMIVTQARHVWSASNAFLFNEDRRFIKIASHGFTFLKNKMWDNEFGGFYELVNRKGEPLKDKDRIIKTAYGNSFAIYGLAAYYKASGDTKALDLAKQTFQWLEDHSFDPVSGGYFQYISCEGEPIKEGYNNTPPKDQNSSIHLLESFTELYGVWKNELLKERLSSLLLLIRDKITTSKGYMNLFFDKDWVHISYRDSSEAIRNQNYYFDHVSFGHDIETAYLLLEASEVLSAEDDSITLRRAKQMVNHTLENGWDDILGGIYDGGYYFDDEEHPAIVKDTKEWWSQAEAMNSLLLMSDLFPDEKQNYLEKFYRQWTYIKTYLVDNENGGWYWSGIDKEPNDQYNPKSSIWKANYHTSRALINCIKRLEK